MHHSTNPNFYPENTDKKFFRTQCIRSFLVDAQDLKIMPYNYCTAPYNSCTCIFMIKNYFMTYEDEVKLAYSVVSFHTMKEFNNFEMASLN